MDEVEGQGREGAGVIVAGYTIHDCAQRSAEWRALRAGRLTASRAGDAIYFLKGGKESAARRDYRMDLVVERLMNAPIESDFSNADTERGVELEPLAVAAYELQTGAIVEPVGFITHADYLAGYSPDGLVGHDGAIEAKAPRPANHIKYLSAGVVPDDHRDQLRHALWITGREWIDFISYSPVFPEHLRLFVVRLTRQQADLVGYEAQALQFLDEVDREHQDLANRPAAIRLEEVPY